MLMPAFSNPSVDIPNAELKQPDEEEEEEEEGPSGACSHESALTNKKQRGDLIMNVLNFRCVSKTVLVLSCSHLVRDQ